MFCWYCVAGGVLSSSFSEGIIIHTSFEDESARVLFQKLQVGDGLSPQPHPTLPCFFDWHILVQYTHDDYSEHTKIVQSTPHPQLEDEHHELPPLTSGILQGLTATQSLLTLGWSCLESIFHCSQSLLWVNKLRQEGNDVWHNYDAFSVWQSSVWCFCCQWRRNAAQSSHKKERKKEHSI